ncbi:MAG TPA: glucoamylase family protein, partial [Anaerolineales bacterium]
LMIAVTALLLLIPSLSVVVSVVNWLVTLTIPPRVLAKMDFEGGIPASCKTMVVIPSLLSGPEEVQSLLDELEQHYLRNQDPNLFFALLTDLSDAPRPLISKDHALVEQARQGIRDLNEKYRRATPGPFYLFHRDPEWNPQEESWMGWERKRGKLHQLNLLLRGSGQGAFSVQVGDLQVLRGIRYVITLDADTIMPREAAHRLVAALAHPLNHAAFDANGAVTAGYTILQPGIEITSTSVNQSRFTRVFAGDVGLDLYTRAVSNAYQDLFGEGIYVGKGIYDVDAFERSLAGRIPENSLLSHDLLEGIHGRVGLVTDIVLFEDYPPHYFVYIRRSRRWIRGDWQLLPWLLPRVPSVTGTSIPNDLSIIDRWKILDNLRRSLLAPALLALLIAGWLWLPGSPLAWTLAGLLTLAAPLSTGVLTGTIQALSGRPWQSVLHSLRNGVVRWLLALVFLLYETMLTMGGITTTLVRLFVTRRGLLQWTSYADTVRLFAGGITWQRFLASGLFSLALSGLIVWLDPVAFLIALPFLIAWMLSPGIAYWISRPISYDPAPLTSAERRRLRALARRTWLFFEQFAGPEDHWLPPDHFQESPRGAVVHSTSPTDIAMLLLSTLGAYDLGYIGVLELSARLHSTFEGIQQLETYQGHLLNWYDTRTFEPLPPRYVSTVDSGNLVAALTALRQGCLDLVRRPVFRWQNLRGLLDTLGLLDELVGELESAGLKPAVASLRANLAWVRERLFSVRDEPAAWASLIVRLNGEGWDEISRALMSLADSNIALPPGVLSRLSSASDRLQHHLFGLQRELEQLFPWMLSLSRPPALFTSSPAASPLSLAWQAMRHGLPVTPVLTDVEELCSTGVALLADLQARIEQEQAAPEQIDEARNWCAHFAAELQSSASAAAELLTGFEQLNEASDRIIRGTDFGFLFDPRRQLFHIGYNVSVARLDANYYDLLASEARIASLVAIAYDQVPQSHWLHLGRPLTQVDGSRLLLSWGGTMFEYLMPRLLMRSYEGTFLHHSAAAAVDVQEAYGGRKNVPWGVSESGYYAFDANQNYQYRSFGVPGLGLKRDLEEDLVVAPYASMLALPLRPRLVASNLDRLSGLGALGTYGLYESIDFSPSRLAPGETSAIVRSYMAHHQGMILLSLLNYLHDDIMVGRFHADPLVRSVDLLLQEKVPYDTPSEPLQPADAHGPGRAPLPRQDIATPWSVPARAPAPQVHLLSNGRYSVLVTSAGAGFSAWQDLSLTRWRADTTCEDLGSWVYLQDMDTGELWSAALQPLGASAEGMEVQFHPHMAEFRRSDHGIGLTMEIAVAPDEDVEVRRISITNHSSHRRRIALTSYAEVVLAAQAAEVRHPAFNKMFIESEYLAESNALLFRRRSRSADEEPVFMAHLAAVSPGQTPTRAYETDRARFLGRGQTARSPFALKGARAALSGTVGATLDPIMSVRQEIELAPRASGQVSFITMAASSREKAVALTRRYRHPRLIVRLFDQARTAAETDLRQLNLAGTDLELMDQVLSALLYPRPALRAPSETLAANRKGQSGLWPFGISGDFPILLIRL